MKTTIKIVLVFFLTIFCFNSCIEEERPFKKVILYVDLSTSFDPLAMEDQVIKVGKMIKGLPKKTRIEIYPMDGGIYTEPLFKYEKGEEDVISVKREAQKQKINQLSDSVQLKLLNMYRGQGKNRKNEYQSCIITSFENAYNNLRFQKDIKNTHVIFMSDMIEQCSESRAGSIFMCSKTRNPDFEEIIGQVTYDYNPDFQLNLLTDDRIHIVVTSNHDNQSRCLKQEEQRKIWLKLLEKIGYENPQGVYYHTAMPDFGKLWNVGEINN